MAGSQQGRPGSVVDAQGGAVIDPTTNVLDLVEKETKRQDDLRSANDRLFAAELRCIEIKSACVKEVADLRATHDKEMRDSEAKRLDSIRQVDIGAVNTALVEVRSATTALAKTNYETAETLRTTVIQTADRVAKTTSDSFDGFNKRIAALELAAAQGIGKQIVADPASEKLAQAVESLVRAQQTGTGEIKGKKDMTATIISMVGLVIAILTSGLVLIKLP